jgi:nucleotide-binding universal stress UspA family protein
MSLVLVATDGSACADRAIDVAADLAKATSGQLLIVTVGNSTGADVRKLAEAEGGVAEALELISSQTLQRARERARTRGAASVEFALPGAIRPDASLRWHSIAAPRRLSWDRGGEGGFRGCCLVVFPKSLSPWPLAR